MQTEQEYNTQNNRVLLQSILELGNRVERLESTISKVQQSVNFMLEHFCSNANSSAPSKPIRQPQTPDYSSLSIQIANSFEKVWYTHRPFPAIVLHVVDSANEIYTKADEWHVSLHLIDAEGKNVDHLMAQSENSRRLIIRKGIVTICGIRFNAVTSKNGGHFKLEFRVSSPSVAADKIQPFHSNPFTVLSCRLFHQPKAPLHKLQASDSLSMMPGIGRLYAKRFASLGISTISQLANLNISNMDLKEQQKLNESLRKDKGTLTMTKLEEYILQAQEIVTRGPDSYSENSDSDGSPPSKRIKSETSSNHNSPESIESTHYEIQTNSNPPPRVSALRQTTNHSTTDTPVPSHFIPETLHSVQNYDLFSNFPDSRSNRTTQLSEVWSSSSSLQEQPFKNGKKSNRLADEDAPSLSYDDVEALYQETPNLSVFMVDESEQFNSRFYDF
eukprot:c2190_g1_i1.p1 GENE.c2190_g1_i1~~c2190_g1_i1.p1  ORF type:complete len:445 (-),score=134.47 c2190_g1_i1:99-1433(-)